MWVFGSEGYVVQDSVSGPVPFNILINYLDKGLEGILSKLTEDTKLEGAVDSHEGRKALQKDLSNSEDWAITNCMKFKNPGKC